jgi:hypothetical protein
MTATVSRKLDDNATSYYVHGNVFGAQFRDMIKTGTSVFGEVFD